MLCACWICVICRGLGTMFLLRPSSGLRHKHVEWLLYLIQVETQVFTWFACRRSGENVSENSAKPFPMVPALVIVRFTEGASVLKKNPKSTYNGFVVCWCATLELDLPSTLLKRNTKIMRKCSVTNHAAKGHTDYICLCKCFPHWLTRKSECSYPRLESCQSLTYGVF